MHAARWLGVFLLLGMGGLSVAEAQESKRYLLRYRFRQGEKVRWEVVHRAKVRTTVGGTTQTAETFSRSIKSWTIVHADSQRISFINRVEAVKMTQWVTDRDRVHYDSQRDSEPPPGLEHVAQSIGVDLARITITPLGRIIRRVNKHISPWGESPRITIPLPEEPVSVGQSWHLDEPIVLKRKDKTVARVRVRQKLILRQVQNGIARIELETIPLDQVRDPVAEAQLVQRFVRGWVKFDIARGRVVHQQFEVDRQVIGHIGPNSGMHFHMFFEEKLLEDSAADVATEPSQQGKSR